MIEFLVHRVVDVGPDVAIQLRVPLSVALQWHPELRMNDRLLRAAADRRAVREATQLAGERNIVAGRWRATWLATHVELEPLHPVPQSR
jgi:hypothetical protein